MSDDLIERLREQSGYLALGLSLPVDVTDATKNLIELSCRAADALAAKDTAISELEAEKQETERLRAIVEERFKDTRLVSAGGRGEGFGFDLMGGPIPYIAEYLAQFMGHREEGGASNYSEMEIHHNEIGAITLTMQRRSGKTPHQLRADADARAAAAEAELERVKAALKAMRDEYNSKASDLRNDDNTRRGYSWAAYALSRALAIQDEPDADLGARG